MTQNHTPITDPHAGVLGHASEDPALLRQCAASGQMSAAQFVEHEAGSIITSIDAGRGYSLTAANIAPTYPICIYGTDNKMLAAVKEDGSVEYGPNYTPDEAARTFWNAMGAGWLGFLAPLVMREVQARHAALIAENATLRGQLQQIADMDPEGKRADDLGRAARVARDALADGGTATRKQHVNLMCHKHEGLGFKVDPSMPHPFATCPHCAADGVSGTHETKEG